MTNQQKESQEILTKYVLMASGCGFVPIPLIDAAAVTLVQLRMLKAFSLFYKGSHSEISDKVFFSAFIGNSAVSFESSAIKFVPGVGTAIGSVSMPILSGALTYAMGKVIIRHFESGGNLDDIDKNEAKKFYEKYFEEGKAYVSKLLKKKTEFCYEHYLLTDMNEPRQTMPEIRNVKNCLFIGISGCVLAADKHTGKGLWLNRLSAGSIITLLYHDNLLYAASKGNLFAIDPKANKIVWESDIFWEKNSRRFRYPYSHICMSASLRREQLFIGMNGYVISIETRKGQMLWHKRLSDIDDHYIVTLFYDEERLYAGFRGTFFALDPDTGGIIWEKSFRTFYYSYLCIEAPAGHDQRLFVGIKGYVLGIEKHTGRELWRSRMPETEKLVTIAYKKDIVYAASWGSIAAFDPETGKRIWENRLNQIRWEKWFKSLMDFSLLRGDMSITTSAGSGDAKILLFTGISGYVFSIDTHTGQVLWRTDLSIGRKNIVTLRYHEHRLYAACDRHFFAIDPESGQIIWRKNLRPFLYRHPVISLAITEEGCNMTNDLPVFRGAEAIKEAEESDKDDWNR